MKHPVCKDCVEKIDNRKCPYCRNLLRNERRNLLINERRNQIINEIRLADLFDDEYEIATRYNNRVSLNYSKLTELQSLYPEEIIERIESIESIFEDEDTMNHTDYIQRKRQFLGEILSPLFYNLYKKYVKYREINMSYEYWFKRERHYYEQEDEYLKERSYYHNWDLRRYDEEIEFLNDDFYD